MAALVDTNVRLQRWSLFRTFGSDCWYRGPQSFVHRADTSRMTFSPHELLAQAERPPAPGVSDGDAWLCCAACQEWRRVDFQSSRVFSTDVYFIRAVHLRLEVMRSQAPRMWQAVHQAASAAKANGERLQVAIYDTTLLQVQATCPTMAGLIDLNRYILDAISHAALAEGVALADNLAALDIDSWNTFCGPKFVCSNLVGVTFRHTNRYGTGCGRSGRLLIRSMRCQRARSCGRAAVKCCFYTHPCILCRAIGSAC